MQTHLDMSRHITIVYTHLDIVWTLLHIGYMHQDIARQPYDCTRQWSWRRKKNYLMVLKGMFPYVIRTYIYVYIGSDSEM